MGIMEAPERETVVVGRGAPTVWWVIALVGGVLGIAGTIWQMVERLAYESDPTGDSFCEINAAVSCSSVYSHWQSSALGLPNALIGLPVFAFISSAAVGALLGSRPSHRYLASVWGLGLFMTVFATWYMEQTAFEIGSLCIFCAASLVCIMIVGVGLTRVVAAEQALGTGRAGRRLARLVDSDIDLALWVGLGVAVAAMLFLRLPW
jgi:uncharacterized membrane protein